MEGGAPKLIASIHVARALYPWVVALPRTLTFHDLSGQQRKVLGSIISCQTPALGGHEFECEKCGRHHSIYHSCRDRHCPQCQHYKSQQWLERQMQDVLPVPYFHVVFTLAQQLNLVFRYNEKRLYDLFFAKAAQTLQEFAADPKHLGAQLGFMGILHTWGQALPFHPHLHLVVAQGGMNAEGQWVRPKYPGKFLFPVVGMSRVFQGKMLSALERLYKRGKLEFPDELSREQFPDQLRIAASKNWDVEIRRPFAGPEPFLRYVGRYTHRVAISSSRLIQADEKGVTFGYKDYRAQGEWKQMTLAGMEFVRRFVQHILPKGFQRLRYFGWMAGGKRREALKRLREQLVQQAKCVAALLLEYAAQQPASPPRHQCPYCRSERVMWVRALVPCRVDSS